MNLHRRTRRAHIRATQAGYTITEVAVVITVMGLVLGATLKAQELIENARITGTLSQVEELRAAVRQFELKYNALPGDFVAAANYIGGGDIANGNGNGIIGFRDTNSPNPIGGMVGGADDPGGCNIGGGSVAPSNDFQESRQFWLHLAAAGLISGVRADTDSDAAATIGAIFPASRLGSGGGWEIVNCYIGSSFSTGSGTGELNHWFRLGSMPSNGKFVPHSDPGGNINTWGVATGYQAYQLDLRDDDGIPTMGGVRTVSNGCGGSSVTTGGTSTFTLNTFTGTPQDTYSVLTLGAQNDVTCVMYFRM